MTPEERFAWVRLRQQRYLTRSRLSTTSRGCMTGRLAKAIKSAADGLRLPVSNARDIRLELASAIFGRSVVTYNELTDAELWAIDQWAGRLRETAAGELRTWLEDRYGSQPKLM